MQVMSPSQTQNKGKRQYIQQQYANEPRVIVLYTNPNGRRVFVETTVVAQNKPRLSKELCRPGENRTVQSAQDFLGLPFAVSRRQILRAVGQDDHAHQLNHGRSHTQTEPEFKKYIYNFKT